MTAYWLFPLAFVVLLPGCSPEGRAVGTAEKYEPVFRACKEETTAAKVAPGEHPCSLVVSAAVDIGLEANKDDEARWRPRFMKWLDQKGLTPYYVPKEKRPKAQP